MLQDNDNLIGAGPLDDTVALFRSSLSIYHSLLRNYYSMFRGGMCPGNKKEVEKNEKKENKRSANPL
ncbi:hypothetical protein VL12_09320 [Rossellomorea marisflavi]|nr:hypothetical protein VL12_09320 [Rossellomorea marisflavi]